MITIRASGKQVAFIEENDKDKCQNSIDGVKVLQAKTLMTRERSAHLCCY